MIKLEALFLIPILFATIASAQQASESADQRPPGPPFHDPAFRAAMQECLVRTGLQLPERGTRPSEEFRAKMDACFISIGVQPPGPPPAEQP